MGAVYFGLGSNLGDRFKNIREATKKLLNYGELKTCSSIWETSPWGFLEQPYFLNCVALFETALFPFELLEKISQIEVEHGRKRFLKFRPRVIDIDILFYGDRIINTNRLVVPHPRLHLRKFMLLPLSEIAPNLVHPVLKKSVDDLLKNLNSKERCKLFMRGDKFLSYYKSKT